MTPMPYTQLEEKEKKAGSGYDVYEAKEFNSPETRGQNLNANANNHLGMAD